MGKIKALYMFKDETAQPERHRAVVETPSVQLTIIGFPNFDEGARIAKEMVSEGVQLIELCGACGYEGGMRIRDAISGTIPIGIVVHQFDNAPAICEFLEQLSG